MKAATFEHGELNDCLSISIHAAREGGDPANSARVYPPKLFQSTPPVKAATVASGAVREAVSISIHAAREGGDGSTYADSKAGKHFNPRRP